MSNKLSIIYIVVSILLTISILLQNQGSGLTSVFGGEGNFYKTRRGTEKFIFISTIVLSIIFLGLGLTTLLISK